MGGKKKSKRDKYKQYSSEAIREKNKKRKTEKKQRCLARRKRIKEARQLL